MDVKVIMLLNELRMIPSKYKVTKNIDFHKYSFTNPIFPGVDSTSVKNRMEYSQYGQHQIEESKGLDGTELASICHIETTGKYDNPGGCLEANFQYKNCQMKNFHSTSLGSIPEHFIHK